MRVTWIAGIAGALIGCGAGSSLTDWDTAEPRPGLRAEGLAPAQDVHEMAPACAPDAAEACDALDSDCDGTIDEGCAGVSPEGLHVALAWNTDADLDLVVEATGDLTASPGRGGCGDGQERVERVRAPAPGPGPVRVSVAYREACGSEMPVTASVSVSYQGRVLGIFNRTLTDESATDIVSFALTPDR